MVHFVRTVTVFLLSAALLWGAPANLPWNKGEGGLQWRTLKSGSGEAAQKGDLLTLYYSGWVQKGGKASQTPFVDEELLQFPLGAGEVIKGWEIGLVGMLQGEERELLIPPHLGYGDRDLGVIPPMSWLLFRVELRERQQGLPPDPFFDAAAIEWKMTTPGVEVFDIKQGSGEPARDGDQLMVHYTGWLAGGTLFASSKTTQKPAELTLGAGQVIAGWEAGLNGLKAGGVRLLRIQPYMGYGAQAGAKIPPHSTLLFTVELLERKGGEESDQLDLFPDLQAVQWQQGGDGLQYAIVAPGEGRAAAAGQKVSVHYTGWLVDGQRFDSSRSRGMPFQFTLAAGEVIPGWDRGVQGMMPGEKRLLKIPAALGYGAKGAGSIPPNAELLFAVELLGAE